MEEERNYLDECIGMPIKHEENTEELWRSYQVEDGDVVRLSVDRRPRPKPKPSEPADLSIDRAYAGIMGLSQQDIEEDRESYINEVGFGD